MSSQAMAAVLASKHEENKIEGMVKNKLANIHSGEWAEEVKNRIFNGRGVISVDRLFLRVVWVC
jgi:hypothetical protein